MRGAGHCVLNGRIHSMAMFFASKALLARGRE